MLNLSLLKFKISIYILKMKLKLSLLLVFGLAISLLSACTSTPKGCQELDWFELGRRDGTSMQNNHGRRAIVAICEDSDQSLSEALYNNGFDSSIAQLCTQKNGFALGAQGEKAVPELCPPLQQAEFMASYQQGQRFRENQAEEKSKALSAELETLNKNSN